jgi:hypothetical protein
VINLNFSIANPWRRDLWNILWNISRSITKHKAVEFNGYRTGYIIDVEFNMSFTGDHAGARVMLALLGYAVELHFYDMRHWDYDRNSWDKVQ